MAARNIAVSDNEGHIDIGATESMRFKTLSILLAVAFAVTGILWFLLKGPGANVAQRAVSEVKPKVSTPLVSTDRSAPPPSTSSVGPTSSPASQTTPVKSPYWDDRYGPTALEGFRRLSAVANTDPAAAAYAADLLASCGHFTDITFNRTVDRIERAPTAGAVKERQLQVARNHRTRCQGIGPQEQGTEVELRKRAAAAGDPRGLSELARRLGYNSQEVIDLAMRGAATQDPLAMREIGMYFAPRSASLAIDLGDGRTATVQQIRDAWFLAACSFGEPCDQSNGMLAARCVLSGWCEASSLEESYLRYSHSPASAETLLHARDVIVRGVTTGVWPPGFWAGRKGS